ncbi:hypothetical protein ACLOJK_019329, partial [Asimina triloba]
LSLAAAMTFLGNLAVTTAPKIFQAHLVSLVSSCIGISIPSSCGQMTPLLLSTYMSAFEESVNLYNKQMVLLLGNGHSIGVSSQSVCQIEPSSTFESHRNFRDAVSESRSDLMSASMAYINESKLVLDESCRVEACRILNCMIQRSLVEEIEVKKSLKSGSSKVLKDSSPCGEYVMNLFMLEEGNLDALKPLLGYAEKPSVYASCLTKLSELKLEDDPGSNFSGAQAAPHGTLPNALDNETMEGDDGQVQNEDEICNGEDFLKCRGVSLDQDGDLADFIACKPGKDYASWWKRRQRYRTWKHQLQASKQKMRHEIGGHGSQGTGVT